MLRRWLVIWLGRLCLTLLLFASAASGADQPFAPEQERILEVAVGKYRFEDVLLCYQEGELLLVPLGQLAQMIDLAIKTSPVSGHAEGFIFREGQTFLLDVEQRVVVIGGVAHELNPQRVRVAFDDIYIDSSLAQSWFGFSLEPNLLSSRLTIRSKHPLPFEERLKREERSAKLAGRLRSRLPSYPRRDEPYQFWETPFIDQSLRAGVARDAEGRHSSTHSYTTYGSGDLLWMDSSWYVSGTQEDHLDSARITLSRKDPDGRVLGPVGLTELSVGHVLEPRVALINQPALSEPGILFSNMPLYRSSTYDTHTFVGDLQPGWEVELYHNDVLLNYQTPNSEGQYQFTDIPLLYGSNYFRLLFYGPQGQRREETQRFEVGQSQTPVGQHHYQVMSRADTLGGNRTIIEYDTGLFSNLSMSTNLVSMPLTEADGSVRQHDYVGLGFHTAVSGAVVSVGMIDDMQSGSAVDWRLQGRLDKSVIGLNHTIFDEFVSEEFTASQVGLKSRSQIRFDSTIPSTTWTPMLPLSIDVSRDQYRNDVENRRANFRLSMHGYGYSVSNLLNWSQFGDDTPTTVGALQTSMRFENIGVRADYQYTLSPVVESAAFGISADITNFHHYNLNAGVTHTMAQESTYLTAGASRDFGNLMGLASLRYGDQGDYLIELGVSFGLGRNPRNDEWIMRSQSLARYGAVAPRAFLDENGNGQQDPNEQPLADVGFQFNGMRRPQLTDEQGDALVTGAFPYQPLGVSIDNATLDDPSYYPANEGVTLVNRPGHVTQLDFPIVMTGEVDGMVSLSKEGRRIDVGGVEVQLVGADGKVIQRARTAYDGFYLFSKVPAGAYEVRIDPEQTRRLGLVEPEPRAAAIHGPDWFSSGVDFRLELETPAGN